MSGSIPGADRDDPAGPLARPAVVTLGRAAPDPVTTDPAVLDLLALVHTTPAGDRALGRQEIHSPESREVASLCARVRSVAEIGAELCLPLAAVQFAVGDLSRAGLVTVRHPPATTRPGADLLERVLHGLVSG